MSKGFVHSIKVPRIYKVTAHIVKSVQENGASLKTLIYEKKHPNISGIYALSINTLQAEFLLDLLLRKTHILLNEPRLDPWLARVLITELLWGKKTLSSKAKPIQTILSYENKLREEVQNINNIEIHALRQNIGTLFLYSVAMFTLPFVVFFGTQHFININFGTDRFVTNCISVLAAVITVNLIISCYVYQALHEPNYAKKENENITSKMILNRKLD